MKEPMNHTSPESSPPEVEQTAARPEPAAEDLNHPEIRYINMTTGTEIAAELVHFESAEIKVGEVAEVDKEGGKKDYLCVDHIDEEEIITVYLIRARSSLWKSLLLLAILGIGWYVIEFVLKHIF